MRMQRRDIRYRLNKKMKIFGNGDQWGAEGEDLNSRAPTGSSMATDKPASLDMAGSGVRISAGPLLFSSISLVLAIASGGTSNLLLI